MSELETSFVNRKRTICEVHREIYDILVKLDGAYAAIGLLHEAFEMAKKMNAKLLEYGFMHERESDANPNLQRSKDERLNRISLSDRGING
jgi:hypothetical protein